MFKKKPVIKPLSPLKSSERRRTADQIIADFGLESAEVTTTDPEDKSAATIRLTALRKSVLPENALSARFTTTAGPDLKQVSGTIYIGSHENDHEPRVLWTKVGEKMYPTVYTLWHNSKIIPLLHTPSVVVEKLRSGADLMTPGLQRGPPFPAKAIKGAIVAIASLDAPTVPVVVGICEIDISALGNVRGLKGQAIQTFHWAGDELWSWSSAGKPGIEPPPYLDGWETSTETDVIARKTNALDLQGENGGITIGSMHILSKSEDQPNDEKVDDATIRDSVEIIDEEELSQKETDDAFRDAFLFGVRHHMEQYKDTPAFGLQLPLSQSNVMSLLVQPFLPTYTPKRTASLQIKKTSWKSIKKFIKYLDKQNIVKCKDRDGNEVVILDIDFKDRQIEAFVPYRLPKKEDVPTAVSERADASAPADSSIGQKLKLTTLFRPKEKLAPILHGAKADPRGLFTSTELKQILATYIDAESLVSPKNKRLVNINPQIAESLLGNSAIDNTALATGTIARDALAERIVGASISFYSIIRNDADGADSKPKAGSPPKIQIVMETRGGNKTVTKVSGVESYFIAAQPLADELRKTCAGSTSVDRLQGSSPKNPVLEVMVQGPQKEAIMKALEKRGVHRNWVEVTDKTKGKKKA